ncbi:MAG: CoA transferase [Pseudomonadota bacterium]|nr:CoA transferase [Pseudomonadota bacterium]
MAKVLDGIVVLDLTRFFSGPQASLFLAALGAEVIKIDDPATGDPTAFAPPFAGPDGVSFQRRSDVDMGLAYLKRARGKKSTTLNLKATEGRAVFLRMVAAADVVIENFSAGVADRLGIGYAELRQANPRIVYCALTGYGSTGPDRRLKAYDLMVQAAAGLMSITGRPETGPLKAGSPISDAIAGTFAAMGVVSALFHRDRTGEGQSVDVSMVDCLFALLFDEPLDCYERLGMEFQQGNRIMRFSPFNAYSTADGSITIGIAAEAEWRALIELMGRPELAGDPRFDCVASRVRHNGELDAIVGAWTQAQATAELQRRLVEAGVPSSPVRDIGDVLRWEQLHAREMLQPLVNPLAGQVVDAAAPGFPIKFSATPAGYDSPAPRPNAHTDEVLTRLAGLGASEIEKLRDAGVVGAA